MNSNTVLSRIKGLLSLEKEEVKFAYAKLADGTIVESATFDVGETVEVVSEDGTKSPAPDGEHELELRDEEGNETRIKIFTEGGVITERENVELEEETIEAEPLPGDTTEMAEEVIEEEEMEEEEEVEEKVSLEEVIEKLSYRIDELEKKIAMAEEVVEEVEEELEEEEEDKKLDGAPVEASRVAKNTGKKSAGYHNSVLSKLYK